MGIFSKKQDNKKEVKTEKQPVVKEEKQEKKASSNLPIANEPFAYQIIKEPRITEKAGLMMDFNKYMFKVFPEANKIQIKKAVEKLYNVKVKNVNIINVVGKQRRIGRFEGWKSGYKKAIVTLKEGKIDIGTK